MTTPPIAVTLATFRASRKGPKCPFGNGTVDFEIVPGACIWLKGNSGFGKTTLATYLAGLSSQASLSRLDIDVALRWKDDIPVSERCGVLFQQTTLIDELTVAGNLAVALAHATTTTTTTMQTTMNHQIQQLLECVGLNYANDANKRPSELSGGMGRRASLALQLAQRKRVIVLDEPFTGLDYESSKSVAKELVHLRITYNTALVLISHEPELASMVMDPKTTKNNYIVELTAPQASLDNHVVSQKAQNPSLFGTTFLDRFSLKLFDFIGWSTPLILLTFTACGLAISMLSCDILRRINVTDQVVGIVDQEVRPLLKLLTGEDANPMMMMMIKAKVKTMLNTAVPEAKATLYAMGMSKLFVLEIGPLLTALLLCGRIGGSYAGKVATMKATAQTKLLTTLGIPPQRWILLPSLAAALIAAPILTSMGTALAVYLGSLVGPHYGIGTQEFYLNEAYTSTFPVWRLRSLAPLWMSESTTGGNIYTAKDAILSLDLRCTYSDNYADSLIEFFAYPPVYHLTKAVVFMAITMTVAELSAHLWPHLTPRHVPDVITFAIVMSSLMVIIADWVFSQLWLQRV
jgi:ABC-type multidrug transport system ATPase subunit/ABC-type transporter Mla maintaining outer membrane lipid asymmetry permease subunit MlaE